MKNSGIEIRLFVESDEEAVVALWNRVFGDEGAHNEPRGVIARKLKVQRDLFFVALIDDRIVGTTMGGYDGHRGWIYSVATDSEYRRRGIAAALMAEVERALTELGCVKVNLQVRTGNDAVEFYRSLDYEIEDRVSMGKRLG